MTIEEMKASIPSDEQIKTVMDRTGDTLKSMVELNNAYMAAGFKDENHAVYGTTAAAAAMIANLAIEVTFLREAYRASVEAKESKVPEVAPAYVN